MAGKVRKTEDEWRDELSAEEYAVCRCGGTEAPFSGKYWDCKTPGTYACAGCGASLFSSRTKYDSGSGWPSFWQSLSGDAISEKRDTSLGMVRTEIMCASCDSHLGHLFPDGPPPTGLRYCVNSAALTLHPCED